MRDIYPIGGMHCGGCAGRIQDALQELAGVTAVSVTHDPGKAVIESTQGISRELLRQTLEVLDKKFFLVEP